MRNIFATLLILGLFAARANAADTALGPMAGTYPGLSLQLSQEREQALHLGLQVTEEHNFIANIDLTRILVSNLFYVNSVFLTGHLYGGMGMLLQTSQTGKLDDSFFYHMPVGIQLDYTDGILQGFAEVALLLGPLPKTIASAMPLIGIRTRF
jgi:hypothetical protein